MAKATTLGQRSGLKRGNNSTEDETAKRQRRSLILDKFHGEGSGDARKRLVKPFLEDHEHVGAQAPSTSRTALESTSAPDDTIKRPFQHKPLDKTKQEFRLCRILKRKPNDTSDLIRCTLTHHILDAPEDHPHLGLDLRYIAVSYCWGDDADMQMIHLNGGPFRLRKNLHNFFTMIRNSAEDENTYFWVDQLCIDQSITAERSHQVRLMSVIYSQAAAVYAWLGNADASTASAFQILRELEEKKYLLGDGDDDAMHRILDYLLIAKTAPDIVAFLDLFSSDYWRRVWIVQEVFLSHELFLLSGPQRQHINAKNKWSRGFRVLCYWAKPGVRGIWNARGLHPSEISDRIPIINDTMSVIGSQVLRKTASQLPGLGWMSVEKLTMSLVPRRCSDPRDQVFGYQACLSPQARITIDYGKSPEELFLDMMKVDHGAVSIDPDTFATRLGLRGAYPRKCTSLNRLRSRNSCEAFLEAVKSYGLSLSSRDEQLHICDMIIRDFNEWSRPTPK